MRILLLAPIAFVCLAQEAEIRIVYDNTSARASMPADWGFSALVVKDGRKVLFDTGTKPDLFIANLSKLGVKAAEIEKTVISHEHPDRRDGVLDILQKSRSILAYFIDNLSLDAYRQVNAIESKAVRSRTPIEVMPGVFTTGMMDGSTPEQALLIEIPKGVVILTGCAHPGVARMVEAAEKQRGIGSVRLLLGGFHMYEWDGKRIAAAIQDLRKHKVERIAPAHCTGDLAKKMMRDSWGAQFDTAGTGKRFVLN